MNVRIYKMHGDLIEAGVTVSVAYSLTAYQVSGWSSLKRRNKMDVIRYRNPEPACLCPHCGSARSLHLYNVSGKYLDDDTDYDWCCRSCGMLLYYYKKEAGTSRRILRNKRKDALEPALPGNLFGRFV